MFGFISSLCSCALFPPSSTKAQRRRMKGVLWIALATLVAVVFRFQSKWSTPEPIVEIGKFLWHDEKQLDGWQNSVATKRLACVNWLGNNISRAQYKRTYAILDALAAEQIPATLFYGSLLGAYRHHGSIPFAKGEDADIAVFVKDWQQVVTILNDLGFHFTVQFNGMYVQGNIFGKYGVDLWIYDVGKTLDGKSVGQCIGPPNDMFWDLVEAHSKKRIVPDIFKALKTHGVHRKNSPKIICKLWYQFWGKFNGGKTWEQDRFPMEKWLPPSRLLFGYSIVPVVLEYEEYIHWYYPDGVEDICGRTIDQRCGRFSTKYPFVYRNRTGSKRTETLSVKNQKPIHTIEIDSKILDSAESPAGTVVANFASCSA